MVKLTPQDEWTRRIAKAKEPPKRRGPKPGVKVGKPRGPAKVQKKPVVMKMSLGAISLYMQGTKL